MSTMTKLKQFKIVLTHHMDSSMTSLAQSSDTLQVTAEQVRRELSRVKPRKAEGPDGANPRVFKACAQLCGVLQHIQSEPEFRESNIALEGVQSGSCT